MSSSNISLSKTNYLLIIVGCVVITLGFILMSGGGTENPELFNEQELFSFRRITLAPFLTILGYMIVLAGVLKRAKNSIPDESLSTKEES